MQQMRSRIVVMIKFILPLIMPILAVANPSAGNEIVEPLENLIELLAGPIGASMMTLALIGAGFMFYSGRWDVMRLVATAIGSGLIFGGANLAKFIMGENV